jgi:hypothetical protein
VKDDRLYLHHMLERCRRIVRFIEPGKETFMASEEPALEADEAPRPEGRHSLLPLRAYWSFSCCA